MDVLEWIAAAGGAAGVARLVYDVWRDWRRGELDPPRDDSPGDAA